ncbi:hypothetical protein SporoP8_12530 [Sporosarcina ureae]|nr:hypothetical protein SporoP8_12530 [Sporosarcina ureae]
MHEGSFFSFMHFFDYVFIKVTFEKQEWSGKRTTPAGSSANVETPQERQRRGGSSAPRGKRAFWSAGERTIF